MERFESAKVRYAQLGVDVEAALKTAASKPIYAGLAKVEPYIWDFTGGVAGYVSTRSLLFPELQAAFSGEKTAAEALANYSKGANEVIQEYMDNSLVLN